MPSILKGNNSIISGNTTFTVRPMFASNVPWDSGNLTPANYAALSGAAFTNTVSMPSLTVNGTISAAGNIQVGNAVSSGLYGDGSSMLAVKAYGNGTVYVQSQAGASYATFNPTLATVYANTQINGTLSVVGGQIQTDIMGNGGLRLLNGGNYTGFIEFRGANTSVARLGYIGFGLGNTVSIQGETAAWTFGGLTPVFTNGISVSAGNTSMVNSTVSGTLTVSSSLILPSGAGSSLFGGGTGDGASYTVYNTKLQIWNGLGLASFDGTINAYYDSRNGIWDTKGVPKVNGQQVWYPGNFNPATKMNVNNAGAVGDFTVSSIANGSFGAILFFNTSGVNDYGIVPNSQVAGRSLNFQTGAKVAFSIDANAITTFSANSTFNGTSSFYNYVTMSKYGGPPLSLISDNYQVLLQPSANTTVQWGLNAYADGTLYFQTANNGSVTGNQMYLSRGGSLTVGGLTNNGSAVNIGNMDVRGQITANGIAGYSMNSSLGGLARLEVRTDGSANSAAFMQFHRANYWAAYLGIDTDNQWKVGGWSMGAVAYKLWHEGNFTPSNYATLSGATFTGGVALANGSSLFLQGGGGQIVTDNAGNGGVRLVSGGATQTGYIEFRTANTAAPRLGYIGYGPTAGGAISITGEGNSYFNFTGNAPKVNNNNIIYITSQVMGKQGYRVWSDGTIEQWGSVTMVQGNGSSQPFNFNIAFPNSCFSMLVTPNVIGTNSQAFISSVNNISKTNFYMSNKINDGQYVDPDYTNPYFWYARGN